MVIPALFTGAGALTRQQDAVAIIANNIANVNTTGFKVSRVHFSEDTNNLLDPASSPTTTKGGTNPTEIGTGMKISDVNTLFTQGSLKNTGLASDLALSGQGFFVVSNSMEESDTSIEDPLYTRDGHFLIDSDQNLVAADGAKVLGATIFDTLTGRVKSVDGYSNITYFTDQKVGPTSSPFYLPNDGIGTNPAVPTPGTTNVTGSVPVFNASRLAELSVRGGVLDNNLNINTTTEGNLSFSRQEDGKLLVRFDNANAGTGTSIFTVAIDTTQKFLDNTLTFNMVNTPGDAIQLRMRLESGVTSIDSVFSNIEYDSVTATSDSMTFTGAAATVQSGTAITVGNDDLKYLTVNQLQSLVGPIKIPNFFYAQDTSIEIETANYSISSDGSISIYGPASEEIKLGRVLVANFTNADGLLNKGGNRFEESSNSGLAAISVIDGPFDRNAPSLRNTSMVSGALEASNVNIANEFAEMITYQRGLQANARTITAS
ncbi:MAG: flagellar hook-basal body complex protein, partial [Candidatus Caenarcaniphilales bacterium]|nr:flagellar hook-basal body complex protein [Candidatus Caenarcaniphilales bacterium]